MLRVLQGIDRRAGDTPVVLKKSVEAADCKRVGKHSLWKERKGRAKSAGRTGNQESSDLNRFIEEQMSMDERRRVAARAD